MYTQDTLKSDDGDTDEGFELFFTELKAEVAEHGEEEVSEEEAQELYQLMKDEYNEVMSMDPNDLAELSTKAMQGQAQQDLKLPGDGGSSDEIVKTSTQVGSMQPSPSALGPTPSGGGELSQGTAARTTTSTATVEMDEAFWSQVTGELKMDLGESIEGSISHEVEEISETDLLQSDFQLGLLREVLPTFSDTRLVRIQRAFHASLREPSILELIPLVRERMPDYLTNTWLKQMSALTSRFVIHKAAQEGLVDMHMLNGVLELEAASGSLERAVEFYETKYAENGLAPNGYTDRMMIQMFLKNNRFSRALAFKQKVESNGRVADLSSYGSFIDFCSRRDQMGSALMLLKECAAVHGATPGEASLTQLRALCRRTNMTDEVGLTDLIGEDPVQWLKHGEAHLKREYSKKGRRNVLLARNRVVHV